MRVKQFRTAQFEFNPRKPTERLCNFDDIIAGLKKRKSLTTWAYIIHDEDTYSQEDIDDMRFSLEQEAKKAGLTSEAVINDYVTKNAYMVLDEKKPIHIHIVIQTNTGLTFEQVGNWLGMTKTQRNHAL
jgi:hypothetical protein